MSRNNSSPVTQQDSKFHCIGRGTCGSVWALPEGSYAFKRGDGNRSRSIWNDYVMHLSMDWAVRDLLQTEVIEIPQFQIPKCSKILKEGAQRQWWQENSFRFPPDHNPCTTLRTERILPLPMGAKEYLIDTYCPDDQVSKVKDAELNENTQCMVRPYLGLQADDPNSHRKRELFSLKNFTMNCDELKDARINLLSIAEGMADVLAIAHWKTEADANDVEFVLASPRPGSTSLIPQPSDSFPYLGEHVLWLLDFDYVHPMSMDEGGVVQAVRAFFQNDPYFPRPGREKSKDKLCLTFRERYLHTSLRIMQTKPSDRHSLPQMFIDMVEQEQEEQMHKNELDELALQEYEHAKDLEGRVERELASTPSLCALLGNLSLLDENGEESS